jgi:hypothetical protein
MPEFGKSAFPEAPYLASGDHVRPVMPEKVPVDQPAKASRPALLKDDLVESGAVIVIVEIELTASAPGQFMRQRDDAVLRSTQLVERVRYGIRPDIRVAEGRGLLATHKQVCLINTRRAATAAPTTAARCTPTRADAG